MKSNYCDIGRRRVVTTYDDIVKACTQEFKKQEEMIYESAVNNTVQQIVCLMLYTMELEYGFKEKRLNDLYKKMQIYFDMTGNKICGKTFYGENLIEHFKEYGLNIDELEFTMKWKDDEK